MTALVAYCIGLIAKRFNVTPVRKSSDVLQPFVKHRTLSYSEFKGCDLLIVGDVHGCYDEAMDLLEIVKNEHEKSFVTIFVGDMVNKGPKNFEMLDFIMKAKNVFCIRGNHEQAVLRSTLKFRNKEMEPNSKWSNSWAKDLTNEQFEFLRNLPYTISIPSLGTIIVHGGINPRFSLHSQNDNDILHMRCLFWKKDEFHGQVLQATSSHEGDLWAQCWHGPEHIYFGHDAVRKLQIEPHCTGLDTGCLYGGKLTGVLLEIPENLTSPIKHDDMRRKFFTVTAKKAYVPVD